MKSAKTLVALAALVAMSVNAQAGLFGKLKAGGASKCCDCAPTFQPECCKPTIVRPCHVNVYNYQRTCAKPMCCNGCGPAAGGCCPTGCAPAGDACDPCGNACAPGCNTGACCDTGNNCNPVCAAPCGNGCAPACAAPCDPNCCVADAGCAAPCDNGCAPACNANACCVAGNACCNGANGCCNCGNGCCDGGNACCNTGNGCCDAGNNCCVPDPGCGAPCDIPCDVDCCPSNACEIAELIYQSQTACYAKDRRKAIHRLGDRYDCVCNPEIMSAFIYALNDADEDVRAEAADEIGDQLRRNPCCCSQCVVQALTCALADCDRKVRREAEQALRLCGYDIVDGCCEVACDTCCDAGCAPGCAPACAPAAPASPAAPADAGDAAPAPAPAAEGERAYFQKRLPETNVRPASASRSLKDLFVELLD